MQTNLQLGSERAFTLVEVLVSTVILVTGLVAAAQLMALATRANIAARATTSATILAQAKMEELQALVWHFDLAGATVTDTTTDLSVRPPASTGLGLSPSPPTSLASNQLGFVDYLDENGRWVGTGSSPPTTAVYTRRWIVEPFPSDPAHTVVVQVLVTRVRDRAAADAIPGVARLPDDARLISVRTRKAP